MHHGLVKAASTLTLAPKTNQEPAHRRALGEVAWIFLKLGFISFGGPAAHLALMEEEVVRKRAWLTRDEFLDLLGATNLIPGPNSTEMAIHLGRVRGGWTGLFLAGACFILPAMFIVLGCAWTYQRLGNWPPFEALLYGIKPVLIAIVLQAGWGLARAATKTAALALLGAICVALNIAGLHELWLLLAAGVAAAALHGLGLVRPPGGPSSRAAWAPVWAGAAMPTPAPVSNTAAGGAAAATLTAPAGAAAVSFGLWPMFWFFVKIGSVLYGSGYVLLAFLRADLVERWHWLTEQQLLDAIAVGQVTPGPVFTTATFIGYLLGGVPGGVAATVGIFLPAFIFVAVSGPLIPRLRASPLAGAVLDGVNVASLGLLAVVTWQMGRAAAKDWLTASMMLVSAVLLFRFRINSVWLIAGGAGVGLLARFAGMTG